MFGLFFSFRRPTHWKNYRLLGYGLRAYVSEQTGITVSQAKRTQPIETPQIDR